LSTIVGPEEPSEYSTEALILNYSPTNQIFDGTRYEMIQNSNFETLFFDDYTIEFHILPE
jgi:hypothetical protein